MILIQHFHLINTAMRLLKKLYSTCIPYFELMRHKISLVQTITTLSAKYDDFVEFQVHIRYKINSTKYSTLFIDNLSVSSIFLATYTLRTYSCPYQTEFCSYRHRIDPFFINFKVSISIILSLSPIIAYSNRHSISRTTSQECIDACKGGLEHIAKVRILYTKKYNQIDIPQLSREFCKSRSPKNDLPQSKL